MSDDRAAATSHPTAVVFDLGGVLVDFDPRHLYRQLIPDEAEMERFLGEVATQEWNLEHDRGRSFDEGVALLTRQHPEHAELIAAYRDRWPEMLRGPLQPTVDVLAELHATGVRLLALTNWSAETFVHAPARLPFLAWFEAILVSGEVGLIKPDPAIYRLLAERHDLDPAQTVFVDDLAENVAAAVRLGFRGIRFTDARALRDELVGVGLLEPIEPTG